MNVNFELGKVNIPVTEEVAIQIEGVKINVEGLDLKEYMHFMKELPTTILGIRHAMEVDIEEALKEETSAAARKDDPLGDLLSSFLPASEIKKEKDEELPEFVKNLLNQDEGYKHPLAGLAQAMVEKKMKEKGVDVKSVIHPVFGQGMSISMDKDNPIAGALKSMLDELEKKK